MAQPKYIASYDTDHLALLLTAAHTKRFVVFKPAQGEEDATDAHRRAVAYVHRTNGLKRALLREGHPMAADCAKVRVRTPQWREDGWWVELSRTTPSTSNMIVCDENGVEITEELQVPSEQPSAKRSYSTPELDFNAILSDGEI